MNAKNFIDALRKVIKEEVRSAVREEFLKMNLNESVKQPTTAKPKFVTTNNIRQSEHAVTKKPVAKKQLSKNPMLNDILNETATFNGRDYVDNYAIDYNDYDEWPTMQHSMQMGSPAATMMPMTDIEGRRVTADNVPEHVVDALTKDYSALMKAIDKKKGLA